MTLVQSSKVFRVYANPGTEDDGYVEPEWRVVESEILWLGGVGEWSYVGYSGEEPEVVYAFRLGRAEVELQKTLMQETE